MRTRILGPGGTAIPQSMTREQAEAAAREVDQVAAELVKVIRRANARPMTKSMALALIAAEVCIHDAASEMDFRAICMTAWKRAAELHAKGTGVGR